MPFKVFRHPVFDEEVSKLSVYEQARLDKIEKKLALNPRGQPVGLPFFFEKRLNGKRVYFLVYDTLDMVLMVAVNSKKLQQATINEIKGDLDQYYEYAKKLCDSPDSSFL